MKEDIEQLLKASKQYNDLLQKILVELSLKDSDSKIDPPKPITPSGGIQVKDLRKGKVEVFDDVLQVSQKTHISVDEIEQALQTGKFLLGKFKVSKVQSFDLP